MKSKSFLNKTGYLLKQTVKEFKSDHVSKLSASLSYYTIFSIPPLLIIMISACGLFFGEQAVRGEIFERLKGLVGSDAALLIQETIKHVKLSGSNTLITIIGVILLISGATGVFIELQESMNYIWGIKTKHKRGLLKFIMKRLMSLAMIGSVAGLFVVGLIASELMDVFDKRLMINLPQHTINLYYAINIMIVFVLLVLLFTAIFRILPDGKIVLLDCLIGAIFTALLFMIGKFAIRSYVGSPIFGNVYGVVGSVILILAWIYYSVVILFLGAEFTKVYAYTHGKKIIPNEHSVLFKKENNSN